MADGVKQCPHCAAVLQPEYRQQLIVWECPKAHGVGVNIFDAVGYLQRDEIDAIWNGAQGAPMSKLPSPITGKPMALVTFMADNDTDYDNVGAGAFEVEVELDVDNYFAWFSLEELASMPTMINKTINAGSAGMVNRDALDAGESKYEAVFADADRYAMDKDSDEDGTLGGMLSGLARRISRR
jgi:hypothetical protein